MTIRFFTFLIVFLAIGIQKAKSQNTISLAMQQEDFKVFRQGIKEMHAGLHWFVTPERFESLYDSVYSTLKDDIEAEQFYLKIRFCMAALKHGHDYVYLPNDKSSARNQLPFVLRYLDQRLFIKVNCSGNDSIPNGSEIVSINSKSVKSLTDEFLQYSFGNGRNTTFKYQKLGVFMEFQYYLKMLYPAEKYDLEIIPFGKLNTIRVSISAEPLQTIADFYKIQTGRNINEWTQKGLEYKLIDKESKIGYLNIATFSTQVLESTGGKLDKQLKKIFTQIEKDKVENLIVDVRNNGGGDDAWQTITSYFRSIPQNKNAGLPYLQSDRFSQLQYVEKTNENRDILAKFQGNPYDMIDKLPDGRFKLKPQYTEHDTKEKPLMPNSFKGKVYLLQNGLTFSASYAFAEMMKELIQKDGGFIKIVGEDNGNDIDAGVGSGGFNLNLILPNSKVTAMVPITGGGLDKPYSNPKINFLDYKVTPTPKELVQEVDVEVELVRKLINKQ